MDMQAKLETGERDVSPIEDRQELRINEGDFIIHRGLLAYIAEKTEHTRRGGKPDQRLRIIFSNGMENDPLVSSLRKALAADKTARYIHRPGLGPLDPEWEEDALELTGTIYVARSKSERPEIKEVHHILHKIGVTSQDVRRRVADARNDATFLLADVDIVATYELRNLSRMKIEDLLHRFLPCDDLAIVYPPVDIPHTSISMLWHKRQSVDDGLIWLRRHIKKIFVERREQQVREVQQCICA